MDRRLRVLHITSLDIAPVYSGGPIRVFHVLKEMAKQAEVTLITPQPAQPIRSDPQCAQYLSSVRILSAADCPPPPAHTIRQKIVRAMRRMHERHRRSVWAANPFRTVCMPRYEWLHLIDQAFAESRPDIVVLEQSWHIETLRYIRRKYAGTPCVLNAHNVKTVLFERALAADPHAANVQDLQRYSRWFGRLESVLYRYVDAVWTCSADDQSLLMRMNRRHPLPVTVVPNGVDPAYFAYDPRTEKAQQKTVIFGGTLCWLPSGEAVSYFYRQVWPLIRAKRTDLRFVIIGREPPQWMREMVVGDASVDLVGEIPDARPYFRDASVAVCPILSGSGTRLKILEAMSMGNPVVSTTIGAEGLTVRDGEHLLLADTPQTFANAVLRLIEEPLLFDRIRHDAHRYVTKHYEWSRLMEPVIDSLEVIANR